MFWLLDKFSDHGLDNSNVAVEGTAKDSTSKSHPKVRSKAQNKHADHGSEASHQKHGFPTDSIRETTPVHAHDGLGQGERRNEESRVCRCIFFAADFESLDELPGVGKDGSECNRFGKTDNGFIQVSK